MNLKTMSENQGILTATISCEVAKEIVKGIENTDEQAVFIFDESGLFVRVSDPYRARVLEIHLPAEDFTAYGFSSGSEQIRVGIVISRLKDITKTLRKGQSLELVYQKGQNKLELNTGLLTRSVRLVRPELMTDVPIISLAHLFEAEIGFDSLNQFLKASNGKGHQLDLITDGALIFASETDEGSVRLSKTPEEVSLKPSDYISMTTFSVEHMLKVLALGNDVVSIRGKQDSAVEFSWTSKAGLKMRAWVGPRV